jgi:hypothetical protein
MIKTNLRIVMGRCIVFIALKFLGKSREKACPLTNHKVKRPALFRKTIVYKLKHR